MAVYIVTEDSIIEARIAHDAAQARRAHNVATRGMKAFRRNHPEFSDNGVDKGWNYESLVKHGGPYNGRVLARIAAEATVEWAEAQAVAAEEAARIMRAADPEPYSSDYGYIPQPR